MKKQEIIEKFQKKLIIENYSGQTIRNYLSANEISKILGIAKNFKHKTILSIFSILPFLPKGLILK